MLHHAVGINTKTGFPLRLGLEPGPNMHTRRIEPREERLLLIVRAVDEVEGCAEKLLVHGFHALFVERSRVHAALPAPLAKARVFTLRLRRGGGTSQDAARTEAQFEFSILGIVRVLRFVHGVEVIEVAEELVEAVNCRQEFVTVTKMVLAELSGDVTERFEQFGKG